MTDQQRAILQQGIERNMGVLLAECASAALSEITELREQLEHDRTKVAECLTTANRAIDSRHWLTEGRGSYEFDDDRWHEEFYAAAMAIKSALAPMTAIAANWRNCPVSTKDVVAARIDHKQRAEKAEGLLAKIHAAAEVAREYYAAPRNSMGTGKRWPPRAVRLLLAAIDGTEGK